jgi:hypothetical protein
VCILDRARGWTLRLKTLLGEGQPTRLQKSAQLRLEFLPDTRFAR